MLLDTCALSLQHLAHSCWPYSGDSDKLHWHTVYWGSWERSGTQTNLYQYRKAEWEVQQYCLSLEKRAWQTQVGKQHQMGLHRAASRGLRPGWWPVKQRKGNIIMISMGKEQTSFMSGQFTGLLMTQSKGYQTLQEMIPNFPLCQLSNEDRAEWRLSFYAYGVTQVLVPQLWSQHPLCDDHFPCRNEINPILLSIQNEKSLVCVAKLKASWCARGYLNAWWLNHTILHHDKNPI